MSRRGHAYISNGIRSSRYTLYDFIPKQILFQATRLSNFYFICVGVPQTIPGLSTTGSYTTILPLLFFMLLTIIKEGYDDYKRHRLDNVENNSEAIVLRNGPNQRRKTAGLPWYFSRRVPPYVGPEDSNTDEDGFAQWQKTKWRDIRVGDILRLTRDDQIPADVVMLFADSEKRDCVYRNNGSRWRNKLKEPSRTLSFEKLQQCSGNYFLQGGLCSGRSKP